MFFIQVSWRTLTIALIAGLVKAVPAQAEVPFTRATVQTVTNQVEVTTTGGSSHRATVLDYLYPGYTLSTDGLSQAELQFNEGSLVRIGEEAKLQFYPATRTLRLAQGTALLFAFPDQGRTILKTPNALTGFQNTAVVVRYVPSRDLTLVMALANAPSGPVAVTRNLNGGEGVLYAGQMALISGDTLQVIEFDLLEFYRTSQLVQGLHLEEAMDHALANDVIARLSPSLLSAIAQQRPFGNNQILNPAIINSADPTPSLLDAGQADLQPRNTVEQAGTAQRSNVLPPGVVMPPSDPAAPVETIPDPNGGPGEPMNLPPETGIGTSPSLEPVPPVVEPVPSTDPAVPPPVGTP